MIVGPVKISVAALLIAIAVSITVTLSITLLVSPFLGLILSAPVGIAFGIGSQMIADRLSSE